jgi:hypothetical protein
MDDPAQTSPTSIVEGEIVQPSLDLTGLINSHLEQITTLKNQISQFRDMLQGIFESDTTYQAHEAAVKEAAKIRNQTKKRIWSVACKPPVRI